MHRVMATRDVPPPPTQRTAGVAASVVGDTAKLTAARWTPWINFSSLRYPGGGNRAPRDRARLRHLCRTRWSAVPGPPPDRRRPGNPSCEPK